MDKQQLERVERECIKCHRTFIAHGRFNRICRRCKYRRHSGCMDTYKTVQSGNWS